MIKEKLNSFWTWFNSLSSVVWATLVMVHLIIVGAMYPVYTLVIFITILAAGVFSIMFSLSYVLIHTIRGK